MPLRTARQIHLLGRVLMQRPICVFICAVLLWAVGISEAHLNIELLCQMRMTYN